MMTNTVPESCTDEYLAAKLEDGKRLGLRGFVRQADYLLRIQPELRMQARQDATTLSNSCPGYTWCDALSVVIMREAYLPHIA